ncbi:MAG: VWA domain-containing protein [Pyrinomonadaceae bacterium]
MTKIVKIAILTIAFAGLAIGQKQSTAVAESVSAAAPVSYGLVVDNSGSFRTLLEKVIKLVSGIIDENDSGDEAFLVTFVDTAKISMRQEMTDNKEELRDSVENMFIQGGPTAILDAVKYSADYLAQQAKSDPARSRVLVLITDGDERESAAKIDDVLKAIKTANIRVFVFAIAEEKIYTKVIDRLAKESGGKTYTPKTRDEIAAAVKSLAAAIRTK